MNPMLATSRAKFIELNTSNILFIAGGAFDGIEKIIKTRLNLQSIGIKCQKNIKCMFRKTTF